MPTLIPILVAIIVPSILCQHDDVDVVALSSILTPSTRQPLVGYHLLPLHLAADSWSPLFIRTSGPGWTSYVELPAHEVYAFVNRATAMGLLVASVCGYRHMNATLYALNARPGRTLYLGLTMDALQTRMAAMTAARAAPKHVCVDAQGRFDAIWHQSSDYFTHFVMQAGPLTEILAEDVRNGREQYYPELMHLYAVNGTRQALALWRKGFGVRYRILTDVSLPTLRDRMRTERRLGLTALSASSDQPLTFVALWRQQDGFSWTGRSIPRSRLVMLPELSGYELEMERVMRRESVPALSVAVRLDGRAVMTIAMGYADLRREESVTPAHRFRVVSVSKTITAMAISRLIAARRLPLDSLVFGPSGWLGDLGTQPHNPALSAITVRQLLEHNTAAWGHRAKLEFERRHLGQRAFLDWVLDEQSPVKWPGLEHLYSNVGYVFLGRVVERVTGEPYADFVNEQVLGQGANTSAYVGGREKGAGEVAYYSLDNANPYLNWEPARLDAAAGWVLAPVQTAAIFEHLGRGRFGLYSTVVQRNPLNARYGRGIQFGADGSLFHVGSLAGAESVGWTRGRVSCAMSANLRGAQENRLTGWMERMCSAFSRTLERRFPRNSRYWQHVNWHV